MDSATLYKMVLDDLQALPEDALYEVRDFVVSKKRRIEMDADGEMDDADRARREAAFARLLKNRGTPDREIDVKKELAEALDERYSRSL